MRAQLLAIHFQDAVNYLETMQLKSQPEKQEISMNAYEDKDVQYIMWYAPMLARLIFDDIVPALRALDSRKVGSLFSYTQEMIVHACKCTKSKSQRERHNQSCTC